MNLVTATTLKDVLPTKPVRYMIYESYIVGGIGAYVIGDLLSGTLKKGTEVILTPGGLRARVNFIERDKEVFEEITPGGTVAISLEGVKCS